MHNTYTFTVTVVTDTAEHAEEVMQERILHDEDYGYDYSINFKDA